MWATLLGWFVTAAALFFGFSQARSNAKPRIVIKILDDLFFHPGQEVKLTIYLLNRPYFYARPTATDICAFVNVDTAVQPLQLRFGAALANVNNHPTDGKDNSRCLQASGIILLPMQSEKLEWHAMMPNVSGDYRFWIDLVAKEGLNTSPYRVTLKVRKFKRFGF